MEHDNSYKRLFSHPEMVRGLFIGFVNEPWVAERVLDWTESWQAEGFRCGQEVGVQKGLRQGMQHGMGQILQAQMASRFGVLPDWALARLQNASPEEVERWSLRVLSEPSLQDVHN